MSKLKEQNIIYIVPVYPSLSEVFIENEIDVLRRSGINITVLSVKKGPALPVDSTLKVIYDVPFISIFKISAHLLVACAYSVHYFKTLAAALSACRFSIPRILRAIRNFSTSVYFFAQIRKQESDHIHAHFISLPTTIGGMLASLAGKKFSCTAHANDIYTTPIPVLAQKLSQASLIITCTRYNQLYLQGKAPGNSAPIIHIYHGLDLKKWNRQTPARNYSPTQIHVLSIGRLVDKKGHIFLLKALSILKKEGIKITCDIVGDGPCYNQYNQFINAEGMADQVKLHGAVAPAEIKKFYETADVFVLPCVIAANGDRDGLPNVLLEAMAMEIPVITTPISAITELIKDGETGVIVAERSAIDIVNAVRLLLSSPGHRRQLVTNGRAQVERYDIAASIVQLKEAFAGI